MENEDYTKTSWGLGKKRTKQKLSGAWCKGGLYKNLLETREKEDYVKNLWSLGKRRTMQNRLE